jgi:hypothetical protein
MAAKFRYSGVLRKVPELPAVCARMGEPCIAGMLEFAVPAPSGSNTDSLLLRNALRQLVQ